MMRRPARWSGVSCRCSKVASIFWVPVAAATRTTSAHFARPSTGTSVPMSGKEAHPNMKTKLCDINAAALEKLPQFTNDKSGVGVHYVDAYLKSMCTKLEDGTAVKCKRRGLKVVLSAGGKKGEGLLRR